MKYKLVALGGTFDLLHKGHKALLNRAFLGGEKVTVGVVADGIFNFHPSTSLRTRFSNSKLIINNKKKRMEELKTYLRSKKFLNRAEIVEINDIYGPTITNPLFEAIVVSEETVSGVEEINSVRIKKGFEPLNIIIVPMVRDENGEVVSSRRIRDGEIDREGRVYKNLFKKTIVISEKARKELKKSQGEVISRNIKYEVSSIKYKKENGQLTILVGDTTVKRFLDEGLDFDIGVIDLMVERKPRKLFGEEFLKEKVKYVVKNKAGTISRELAETVDFPLHLRGVSPFTPLVSLIIRVIGEEDLAAVPAVLLSPLGTLVFYGQPKEGLVKIKVTEEIKEKLVKLLENN